MSEHERWQDANSRYLSAALAWLRLRLERFAGRQAKALVEPDESHGLFGLGRFFRHRHDDGPPLLPEGNVATDGDEAKALRRMADAEAGMSPPPALVILAQRLGLSRFEQDLVLLCAACELDTRIPRLCGAAQGDGSRPWPTFALALSVFDHPAWDVMAPERPIRYLRLIEAVPHALQPLTSSPLRADERIINYLKGLNHLDERLTGVVVPARGEGVSPLPPSQQQAVDRIVHRLARRTEDEALPVIQLAGSDLQSKLEVAVGATTALDLHLYRLPLELLPTSSSELETFIRLWQRESLLLPLALFLDAQESERTAAIDAPHSALSRFLSRIHGLVFVAVREPWTDAGHSPLVIDVEKPTVMEQRALWQGLLGGLAPEQSSQLAAQFHLSAPVVHDVARTVLADPGSNRRDESLPFHRAWSECLLRTRPRLDALAERITPKAGWRDLVLPAAETALLQQIADQVRQRGKVYEEWGFARRMNRGLGISALFAGESGTGKTMSAEVLAHELELNLFRIDLSSVVSKYIGETERNLRRLFDAAENGGAVLFFDEADALFGKRSEVKDSHDRYANIEINYLLQRMEAYQGIAILATNMKSSLDRAFLRRLRFLVQFPFPGPADRRKIWERAFPPETSTDHLHFERLARLNLSGGSIHNVALNAAFLAAHAGTSVTMPLLLEAARTEFRKLERPIHEADFQWLEPVRGAA
ncbi:MAG TPA: ATP-binding protein [Candidatus Eisenbacteria bacterium]|nr:ATP-binding protein [Candidatus Eisenbacteria bacterium]